MRNGARLAFFPVLLHLLTYEKDEPGNTPHWRVRRQFKGAQRISTFQMSMVPTEHTRRRGLVRSFEPCRSRRSGMSTADEEGAIYELAELPPTRPSVQRAFRAVFFEPATAVNGVPPLLSRVSQINDQYTSFDPYCRIFRDAGPSCAGCS